MEGIPGEHMVNRFGQSYGLSGRFGQIGKGREGAPGNTMVGPCLLEQEQEGGYPG